MNEINIYTDGSCLGNPGPGGWGVVILCESAFGGWASSNCERTARASSINKEIKLSGGEKDSTNNRMEMTAIIKALEWLRKNSGLNNDELLACKIIFHADSNLLVQTLNLGWKRKANTDLWAELDRLRAWLNIEWKWVKAHHTDKYNNMADELALAAATKQKKDAKGKK